MMQSREEKGSVYVLIILILIRMKGTWRLVVRRSQVQMAKAASPGATVPCSNSTHSDHTGSYHVKPHDL